ncbi:DUF2577 domain-containing protein [Acidaminococcus intestini]|jgi:hypothetical protein|uniref:DUF2577 domain-containing protein n=1 Tax=Acidaminococcus intestini TaxID=187327 RepID=UPI0020613C6D|nr:DUF2577 domain-containing protein [Acidaminococcus intestini]DAP59491.1 MAG TPA: Protein of unknown function (DUF2577) [Caudoviricetes sp.]
MNAKLYQVFQEMIAQNVNDMKLGDYILGTVESVSPLSVRISNKDVITSEFLILTDMVRDYQVDISVNHTTENAAGGSGDAEYASHNHAYVGRKTITVHNGLSAGEVVILLRQAGAQQYLVLCRYGAHANISGQWG